MTAQEVLCSCGHTRIWHNRISLLSMPRSRYERHDLCRHVAELGTMSLEALRSDCGCQGWSPDPSAVKFVCDKCKGLA